MQMPLLSDRSLELPVMAPKRIHALAYETKIQIFEYLIPQSIAHGIAILYQYRAYSVAEDFPGGLPDPMLLLWIVYTLCAVCQNWRGIVMGTPRFWTSVIFPIFDSRGLRLQPTLADRVRQHFLLSAGLPMHVYVASFLGSENAALFRPLVAYKRRIHSLTVVPPPAPAQYRARVSTVRQPEAATFRPLDLPCLASLAIGSEEWHDWDEMTSSPLNQCQSLRLIIQAATTFYHPPRTYANITRVSLIIMPNYSGMSLHRPGGNGDRAHMLASEAIRWTFESISTALPNLISLDVYFPANLPERLAEVLDRRPLAFEDVALHSLSIARFHAYDYRPSHDQTLYPTFLSTAMKDAALHPFFVDTVRNLIAASQCNLSVFKTTLPPSTAIIIPLTLQPRTTMLTCLTLCADAGSSDAVHHLSDVSFLPLLQELHLIVLDNDSRIGFDTMSNIKNLLLQRRLRRMTADASAMQREVEVYKEFLIEREVKGFFHLYCEGGVDVKIRL